MFVSSASAAVEHSASPADTQQLDRLNPGNDGLRDQGVPADVRRAREEFRHACDQRLQVGGGEMGVESLIAGPFLHEAEAGGVGIVAVQLVLDAAVLSSGGGNQPFQ